MVELKRRRSIELAGLQVRVALPERTAQRISSSGLYRYAFRPAAKQAYHALRWIAGSRRRAPAGAISYIPATAPSPEDVSRESLELIQEVAPLDWNQSIHVGHGVITPGRINHYRHIAEYGLPESLEGMRCLDAAPGEGFWAFEMVRRGGAEVVALDLAGAEQRSDRAKFETAERLLGCSVRRAEADLYDLEASDLGKFDLIVLSDYLHRLRDPQRVLEGLYAICRGRLVLSALFQPLLERYGEVCLSEFVARGPQLNNWWMPNSDTLRTMMWVAGFMPVQETARFDGDNGPTVVIQGTVSEQNAWSVFVKGVGDANGNAGHKPSDEPSPARAPVEGPMRKTLKVGKAEVFVEARGRRAARIARSAAYRRVLRPALNCFAYPQNAHVATSSNGQRDVTRADEQQAPNGESTALTGEVAAVSWYHTIDLGHGIVTPGFVDHRSQLSMYRLPERLDGQRCLDVATFDGFWAFEMERRGAREVVATDIADGMDCDLPARMREEAATNPRPAPMGAGFRIARKVLNSRVEHRILNVYDLSPSRIGMFDFVFLGDLLLHLRDPQAALTAIASVCHGEVHVAEVYDPALEDFGDLSLSRYSPWLPSFTWWLPSTNTLRAMLAVAGFTDVRELDRFVLKTRDGQAAKVIYRAKGTAPAQTNPLERAHKEVG
jgi:2-polyprenyl-3-methyl-5-hydroxy-6-metoxy-1,4-benzoquinol methylase